jgi:DNA polymerase-1
LSFYILDIETNGIDSPDKLWCIVCKDLDTQEVATYSFPSGVPAEYPEALQGFLSSSANASGFIGHNIIGYDLPTLKRLIPEFTFDKQSVIDTLVVGRLLHYNIEGGNSLEAWGNRLGFPKSDFSDFSSYSQQMLDYCIQDVLVTEKLYAFFSEYIRSEQWQSSLRLEHDVAWLCNDLNTSGFSFDAEAATTLLLAISGQLGELAGRLHSAFAPRARQLREVNPKRTASGALSRVDFRWLDDPSDIRFFSGGPFTRIAFEPFNPGSPKQCVERLWECGWKPFDKTKGHIAAERELADCRRFHGGRASRGSGGSGRVKELEERLEHFRVYGYKVNEANLATLPRTAPAAAHDLVEWLTLDSRRSTLEEWLSSYNPDTGRIHGRFNHIGAWTGRMSHNSPNMANIPGHGSVYGDEFRALWRAGEGKHLVGVDADGIQLRILAHYMNDPDFIAALDKGRKEDGTDAHTLNQRALGSICNSRDVAKTFIYAFLLGAGTGKISEILSCSPEQAREAVDNFLSYYPGLRNLKDHRIPADADRGYFIGLDGRLVACDSQHLMLAGYLQNGEAVVMKTANLLWRRKLEEENIPFNQVNFVHDEWQVEVQSLTDATRSGILMVDAIVETGTILKLNCPLAGNAIIGRTWLETH